jgi:flavin reductase (DIM6/NTAB) family NADH-FMN oxidoreductase RutF
MQKMKDFDEMRKITSRVEEGAFLVVQGKEQVNVMTIGWALWGVVWRRPTMMVAVRTSRFTHKLFEQADSFTVTFPGDDRKKELTLCGSKSGRDMDKFKECGFSTAPSRKIGTPVLNIPGYHFECRILYKTPMDPKALSPDLGSIYPAKDYHTLYFGEILASYQTSR